MLSVIYARLRFAADTAAEVAALAKAEQNSVRMSDAGSKKSWVAPDQVGGRYFWGGWVGG